MIVSLISSSTHFIIEFCGKKLSIATQFAKILFTILRMEILVPLISSNQGVSS